MARYVVGDDVLMGVTGTVRVLAAYDAGAHEFDDDRYDVETSSGAVLLRVALPEPDEATAAAEEEEAVAPEAAPERLPRSSARKASADGSQE